ncbi:AzlD domain-containing protein [Lipingzhangella sp. LS1_29]|uniref:AzlD domain-containing protein n=1 Tax=Lipingzhangella rawalii TaxID=2055835 RepID=A0ABU2H3F4_9ACTN|nr:AzlD domain-containing protein [Lipingzhangella rawalii]MDS1269379.1 AzlD domain-containing protein [Lipingzhangella rawalii]
MSLWIAVLVTALGCFALKLAGLAAPQRLLNQPHVQRFAAIVPVALLAALIVLETFAAGQRIELDAPRLAGVSAAALALLLRAPFLLVLVVAAATTASLRLAGLG